MTSTDWNAAIEAAANLAMSRAPSDGVTDATPMMQLAYDIAALKMPERMTGTDTQGSFQQRLQPWLFECFGEARANDREERNQRFLEEALELVQSTGCHKDVAHYLVDYVYARPIDEPALEVGNVMTALAALCLANGLDLDASAEIDLAHISKNVGAIRARHEAKPLFAPIRAALTTNRAPVGKE